MGCGKTNRSCNQKSCQRYYNNNPQAIAVGDSLTLTIAGAKVVDTGVSIETSGQSYEIVKPGLYHISGDVTIMGTTAGDVQFVAYLDGVQLPCTFRMGTLTAAGYETIHTETDLSFQCGCESHVITFVVNSPNTAVGTVTEFCSGITKLA